MPRATAASRTASCSRPTFDSRARGVVTPIENAVGSSPWMDVSGSYGASEKSGLTVLTHPSTTGFPQPRILRARGSMQNAVYPGRQPVACGPNVVSGRSVHLSVHLLLFQPQRRKPGVENARGRHESGADHQGRRLRCV
jgi:hypothetical protein